MLNERQRLKAARFGKSRRMRLLRETLSAVHAKGEGQRWPELSRSVCQFKIDLIVRKSKIITQNVKILGSSFIKTMVKEELQ